MLARTEMDAMIAKVTAFMKKNDAAVDAPATRADFAQPIASSKAFFCGAGLHRNAAAGQGAGALELAGLRPPRLPLKGGMIPLPSGIFGHGYRSLLTSADAESPGIRKKFFDLPQHFPLPIRPIIDAVKKKRLLLTS